MLPTVGASCLNAILQAKEGLKKTRHTFKNLILQQVHTNFLSPCSQNCMRSMANPQSKDDKKPDFLCPSSYSNINNLLEYFSVITYKYINFEWLVIVNQMIQITSILSKLARWAYDYKCENAC